MAELPESILAEQENVETALANLQEALARNSKSVVELAAIATFLHNAYNGIENILKQVLAFKGIDAPKSDTWHVELLRQSASAGIVSVHLNEELRDYLGFRHFFIHGYGFMLEDAPLQELAKDLPDVWARFLSEIEHFFETS
jgi:uncharacterized protein YutE (UPF0331/DUF86 family)